jgi:hypothetical protein
MTGPQEGPVFPYRLVLAIDDVERGRLVAAPGFDADGSH